MSTNIDWLYAPGAYKSDDAQIDITRVSIQGQTSNDSSAFEVDWLYDPAAYPMETIEDESTGPIDWMYASAAYSKPGSLRTTTSISTSLRNEGSLCTLHDSLVDWMYHTTAYSIDSTTSTELLKTQLVGSSKLPKLTTSNSDTCSPEGAELQRSTNIATVGRARKEEHKNCTAD